MKRIPRPTIAVLVMVALVALAGTLARLTTISAVDQETVTVAKPALSVTATTLRLDRLPIQISASGDIMAWQEASIGTEASGLRLTSVNVDVGDVVRRGSVLAVFASETIAAELAQSSAAVAEAEAALAEASDNAERAKRLKSTGAMSEQQINQYLTADLAARARFEAMAAAERTQQLRLAQTRVLAPDDGVISANNATVGGVFPTSQELFRLIRRGRLEWRAEVAAVDLALLKPGQMAQLTPAGGATIVGTLRMVAPIVDTQSRNGLAYVDLPPNAPARHGMFALGEFHVGTSEAMTLPQSAVLLRDGFSYVMRVGADAKILQTKVIVGRRAGDRIEIISGLEASVQVVASGVAFLSDGDLVRLVENQVAPTSGEPNSGVVIVLPPNRGAA